MAHPNQIGERIFNVQSAGTAGSSAAVTNTTHHKLDNRSIRQIMVYSATQIYFNFTIAETESLFPVKEKTIDKQYRAFIAVKLQGVRLIDNIALN